MQITIGMLRFLDERSSKGITTTLDEIKKTFNLTDAQAFELIRYWMNIPLVVRGSVGEISWPKSKPTKAAYKVFSEQDTTDAPALKAGGAAVFPFLTISAIVAWSEPMFKNFAAYEPTPLKKQTAPLGDSPVSWLLLFLKTQHQPTLRTSPPFPALSDRLNISLDNLDPFCDAGCRCATQVGKTLPAFTRPSSIKSLPMRFT